MLRLAADISELSYLDTGRFRGYRIFLSVGGLQQCRVFGALTRSFGHYPGRLMMVNVVWGKG